MKVHAIFCFGSVIFKQKNFFIQNQTGTGTEIKLNSIPKQQNKYFQNSAEHSEKFSRPCLINMVKLFENGSTYTKFGGDGGPQKWTSDQLFCSFETL